MDRRTVVFLNSVFFVAGFTLVFSLAGVLLQTILSSVAFDAINILRLAGGAIIILLGVFMLVSLKYSIPFLMSEHKLKAKKFHNRYLSSLIFGMAFAAGWTPCVGAILGSIYALAAISPGAGFFLLFAFSLGLGVPFLIAGLFTSRVSAFLDKSQSFLKYFHVIGGLFLIAIGILVVTNYIGILASFFVTTEGAVTTVGQINFAIAFVAGLITFMSPCILPLLPAYFSYMAGTTASDARKR